MKHLISILKNPIAWTIALLIALTYYQTTDIDSIERTIHSDGEGYYSYLPALFIYNDGTFEKSSKVESSYNSGWYNRLYLYETENGKTYNKYFPGFAVLHAPFFGLACFTAWVSGYPIDGYSMPFHLFVMIGSLFYAIMGVLLFYKSLNLLYPNKEKQHRWFVFLSYLATPLLFYSTMMPAFSHHLSFFLFGLFTLSIVRIKEEVTAHRILWLGVIVGMIFLVRPTNVLIILIIPFLLGSKEKLTNIFRQLFITDRKLLIIGLFGALCVMSILFLCWKWQTGSWIVWSYQGEGFDFINPHFFDNLFSFRIGLFIHTPILILSIVSAIVLFNTNRFQAFWWWIYFLINAWVISSWWCWDYASAFGNRPFTEHLLFLLLPVLFIPKKHVNKAIGVFVLFALLGGLRFIQYYSGNFTNQKFTASSYFGSLEFWNPENSDRWKISREVKPFGNMLESQVILEQPQVITITPSEEFALSAQIPLEKPRTNERYFYRVELDKKIEFPRIEDTYVVVDAFTADGEKHHYIPIEMYEDRLAGYNVWQPLIIEGMIHDNFQNFDFLKIYIWNNGRKTFHLRNVKMTVETYKD